MIPHECMLAHNMDKPIDFYTGWMVEIKEDGVRALIMKEGPEVRVFGRNQTKKGRADFTPQMPEIVDFFKDYPSDFTIDCELCSKDFLKLQTKVRTTKHHVEDPDFFIRAFDILKWDKEDYILSKTPAESRYLKLQKFVNNSWFEENKFLKLINQASARIESQDQLDVFMQKVVDKGHEGLILKDPAGTYEPGKRHRQWTKCLPHREMDCLFLGPVEGEGKQKNMMGALRAVALDDKGNVLEHVDFNVGTGFTDEDRLAIWELPASFWPCSGKIKVKELHKDSGRPRCPVFKSFNVDKETT